MKKISILLLLFVYTGLNLAYSQSNGQLTSLQKTWLSKADRHEKNGWVYLHFEGSAEERGFQHGYLMASDIKEAIRVLSVKWVHQTALGWDWYVQKAGQVLTPKIDAENLAEIDGIVEGMKSAGNTTSRNEVVALNGYVELMGYWWPSVKDSMRSH